MLVGYMRVSTDSDRQVLDLQRDALLAAGVDERHLFEDRASGSRGDRTGLAKALAFIKSRRLPGGLETGPVGPIIAASPDHSNGPQETRHRLPFADRADGHHDAAG